MSGFKYKGVDFNDFMETSGSNTISSSYNMPTVTLGNGADSNSYREIRSENAIYNAFKVDGSPILGNFRVKPQFDQPSTTTNLPDSYHEYKIQVHSKNGPAGVVGAQGPNANSHSGGAGGDGGDGGDGGRMRQIQPTTYTGTPSLSMSMQDVTKVNGYETDRGAATIVIGGSTFKITNGGQGGKGGQGNGASPRHKGGGPPKRCGGGRSNNGGGGHKGPKGTKGPAATVSDYAGMPSNAFYVDQSGSDHVGRVFLFP